MKVLLINGIPRKEGNTFVTLKEFASQLAKNGVDRETVDVEILQTVRTLANNMSWLLKKIATGEGEAPSIEGRTAMNFIR